MVSILLFTRFLNIQPVVSRISEPSTVLVILITFATAFEALIPRSSLVFFPLKFLGWNLTKNHLSGRYISSEPNIKLFGVQNVNFSGCINKKSCLLWWSCFRSWSNNYRTPFLSALRLAKGHAETISEMGVRHEYVNPLCFYHNYNLCLKNASKRLAIYIVYYVKTTNILHIQRYKTA